MDLGQGLHGTPLSLAMLICTARKAKRQAQCLDFIRVQASQHSVRLETNFQRPGAVAVGDGAKAARKSERFSDHHLLNDAGSVMPASGYPVENKALSIPSDVVGLRASLRICSVVLASVNWMMLPMKPRLSGERDVRRRRRPGPRAHIAPNGGEPIPVANSQ